MSLLLYCVALESVGETGNRGVGGSVVQSHVHGALRYFVSWLPAENMPPVAMAAREVLAVVNDVFSRGPVLPFRYPTVLQQQAELVNLAAERGESFADFLRYVGMRVQMDVRLTVGKPDDPPSSGRAYLASRIQAKDRLRQASEQCRQLAEVGDWRAVQRGGNLVCHALIGRDEVISFQERMRRLDLPGGMKAIVSGPWPPAGFWEEKLH